MGELGEWELKDEALAYQGLESGSAATAAKTVEAVVCDLPLQVIGIWFKTQVPKYRSRTRVENPVCHIV